MKNICEDVLLFQVKLKLIYVHILEFAFLEISKMYYK